MSGVPLGPPARYREEGVDYLHLEFGESRDDPDAPKPDDLKYVGLFSSGGVPTYYWAYPVSNGPREYATWEVYANTYCGGMTGTAPDPATRITGEPQSLQLTRDDVKGMFHADPVMVDFAAVDDMVAISRPDESTSYSLRRRWASPARHRARGGRHQRHALRGPGPLAGGPGRDLRLAAADAAAAGEVAPRPYLP